MPLKYLQTLWHLPCANLRTKDGILIYGILDFLCNNKRDKVLYRNFAFFNDRIRMRIPNLIPSSFPVVNWLAVFICKQVYSNFSISSL